MPTSDATPAHTVVIQTRYGRAPDVLSLSSSVPLPPPRPNQVQIQVRAASINPIDWQMIEGNRSMIAKRAFPFVPLFDIAGIVVATGASVTRLQPGDVVHCDNQIDGGGAGQFVNVDEQLVSLAPPQLSFAEAATVPLAGQTALLALDKAKVGPGSTVCVIGASGGVGSFAVQIARALGAARVIGVCSGQNAAFVRVLGADDTIDYHENRLDAALAPETIDAVIDCVGGKAQWLAARRILRRGGRFATISRDEDDKVTLGAIMRLVPPILWRRFTSRFGRRIAYQTVFLDASHTLLDRVDEMVRAGKVRPHVARTYPADLEGIVAALEASRQGRTVGKLVIERH